MLRRRSEDGVNKLLATIGVGLLAVAVAALFLGKPATVVGPFLFLGVAVLLVAVFEPRMEGRQEITPTGLKLNLRRLKRKVASTEKQLKEGKVVSAEEVIL